MAGLSTRLSVRMTVATSPSGVSRPYWAAITWCPSVWSGAITLLKHEPSAQRPWQKTMLGLLCGDMHSSFGEDRRPRRSAADVEFTVRLTRLQRIARSCDLLSAGPLVRGADGPQTIERGHVIVVERDAGGGHVLLQVNQ